MKKWMRLLFNDENLCDVIHGHENPEELELKPFAFSGVLLIPYVGHIFKGKYSFLSKEYSLPINTKEGHSIHGLLYNKSWNIKAIRIEENTSVTYSYHIDKRNLKGYPFNLDIEVNFCFNNSGIKILTRAINSGDIPLPIAFGWHPYIKLQDEYIDDCFLLASFKKSLCLNEDKIPTGELIDLNNTEIDFTTPRKLNKIVLDNVFTDLQYINGFASIKFYSLNNNMGIELW